MPITRRRFFWTAALPLLSTTPFAADPPKFRLARKDSFFGLHFDLHPNQNDTTLGRDLTDEMVSGLLSKVKPDYVQYDCKGHAGYLAYPSKVGTSAPGIVKDSLQIWRRVTAAHGVALYIHFSGILDSLAIQQNPSWAAVHADGSSDPSATSTFGPYVDKLMIPQLLEAAEKYALDGAWVDGDCWSVRPDYSPAAVSAFSDATGIRIPPKGAGEQGWLEFLEFNRQQFRKYAGNYVNALHRFNPKFQVSSNWLYTTYVPERPQLPVDFISGDYTGNASVSTARLEARYLSAVGMPWDLMAWGFQPESILRVGRNYKPAVQLQQEASIVLAQGGGFQLYYNPSRAGKIDDRHIAVMTRVSQFCRVRQRLSHRTEPVPQIGLLFSKNSLYSTTNKLFGGWGPAVDPARGLLDALIENHYSVDVVPDWKLEEVAGLYPLIVVPEWPNLGEEVKHVLSRHVQRGGRVIIVGAENTALFSRELPVRFSRAPAEQDAWVADHEVFANLRGVWQEVLPVAARVIEQLYPTSEPSQDGKAAATLSSYGAGKIAAIYGPIGIIHAATHTSVARHLVRRVVEQVFEPTVRLQAPPTVELVLRKKGMKLLVHLINCTGMQVASNYVVTDFIPPVGPLRLEVQTPHRPLLVKLEPEGQVLLGEWKNGVWRGNITRLEIHSVCAFELK